MEFVLILGMAIILVALAFAGLAVKVLLKKRGRFPNIHIGSNKHLRDRGIVCAQTFDKMEQAKAQEGLKFKELSLSDDQLHVGC